MPDHPAQETQNAKAALRRAWEQVIEPDDYEAHMAAIGQAEANARLMRDLIQSKPLPDGSKLLFAGAGTGQMFDYVEPDFLKPYSVTFTDIRLDFLDRLETRLRKAGADGFVVRVEDIEQPSEDSVDGAALALVLEHVDWRKALDSLITRGVRTLYPIIQINPAAMADMVAPTRVLPHSMAAVSKEAKPELIDPAELEKYLAECSFECLLRRDEPVADGKTMAGYVFCRLREGGQEWSRRVINETSPS